MKDLNLFVWITQLGLTVAVPLAGFILLGVWLHESCGWGVWTIWAGVFLGIYSAVDGFRASLKILDRVGNRKNDMPPPATSFNDHD
jgi:hypothetical protein